MRSEPEPKSLIDFSSPREGDGGDIPLSGVPGTGSSSEDELCQKPNTKSSSRKKKGKTRSSNKLLSQGLVESTKIKFTRLDTKLLCGALERATKRAKYHLGQFDWEDAKRIAIEKILKERGETIKTERSD